MEAKEFFEHYEKNPGGVSSLVARHIHQYLRSKTSDRQFNMEDTEQVLSMLAAKDTVVYEMLPTLREIPLQDIYLSHRKEINNSIINDVVEWPNPDDRRVDTTDSYDFNFYEVIPDVTKCSLDWAARSIYTYWGYVKQELRGGRDWRL